MQQGGAADPLSSPRRTVPTASQTCLGTARSERGQELGDSSSRASPDTPDIPLQPDTGAAHACFQPEAGGLRLPLANPARAATSAASPLAGRSARHRVASCGMAWHRRATPGLVPGSRSPAARPSPASTAGRCGPAPATTPGSAGPGERTINFRLGRPEG